MDRPEKVREAIEFAYQLNVDVQQTFFQHAPLLAGGTCSNMVEWIPGRIVSESVDPFHMTSVDYFEALGTRAGGANPGGPLMAGWCTFTATAAISWKPSRPLRGLKAVFLADDLHFPSAFSMLGKLRRRLGDMPVVVKAEFPEFVAALDSHRLEGGVLYKVQHVPDAETANRTMDQVREYVV